MGLFFVFLLPKASIVLCGIIYLCVTAEQFCVLGNVTRASINRVEIGWTRNFKWTILLRLVNGAVAALVWKTTNKTAEAPVHHHLSEGELYKSQLKTLTSHLLQFSLNAANDLDSCFFFCFPPPVFSHRFADARRCTDNDEGEPPSLAQPLQNAKAVSAISGNFTVETLHWLNPTNLFIWSLEIHVLLCSQGYCGGKKQGY